MREEAVKKITEEMKKEGNPYVQVVGEYLLGVVKENEGVAEKILAADKTIMGSLKVMGTEAKKKKVGNCAVLTDKEGFEIVLKYYGITPGATTKEKITNKVISIDEYKKNTGDVLDINLDDLLI